MAQIHLELEQLSEMLSGPQRDQFLLFTKVPEGVFLKYIKHHQNEAKKQSSEKKDRFRDFENRHESTLEVLVAIRGSGDCRHLLKTSRALFDPGNKAKILNVVASVKLGDQIELDHLASNAWNIEYNKKNFSGVVIQLKEPDATGIVYSTGRMIVTGPKSEEDSKNAAEQCVEIIRNAGCPVKYNQYRIQNICGTINLGYRIRIHEMGANKDIKNSARVVNFTPEIFAGLVCTFKSPRCTVVCFATGTLLFSGAHREDDVQVALERFRYLSYPYKY